MKRSEMQPLLACMAAIVLLVAAPSITLAKETAAKPATAPTAKQDSESAEKGGASEVDKELAARRKEMLAEAQDALQETNAALVALDKGKNQDAIEALTRATGKLDLLVARDPELALAPVDVQVTTYDLYATPAEIRSARDRAEALLDDGKVQAARSILSDLASEVRISVFNLPLATYPDAIEAVTPLIDEGKTEQAKTALRDVLDTLVVTDEVISLPVMRSAQLLDEAEKLVKKDDRTEEDNQKIASLVDQAREQLEMADLLGYGGEEDHQKFRKQIAELETKIHGDQETSGVFARLRKSLDGFRTSFFQ